MGKRTEPTLVNEDAEASVLGSVLLDPSCIVNVRTAISPVDFGREANGLLFQAMLDVHDSGSRIDFVTVSAHLEQKGLLDKISGLGAIGAAYLTRLINAVPTSVHVIHYANIVKDLAVRRGVLEAARQMALKSVEADTAQDAVTAGIQALIGLQKEATSPVETSVDALDEVEVVVSDWLHNPREVFGIGTGLKDLDYITGGLNKGDFVIVAGRPGMGKSAIALQMAAQAAQDGHGVLFFSLEMSKVQLIMRLVCSRAEIDTMAVRRGRLNAAEQDRFYQEMSAVSRMPIYWSFRGGLTPEQIHAECARIVAQHSVDVVIVDYLQLVVSDGETENIQLTKVSHTMKRIAMEMDVAVIGLSQLSRAVEARGDDIPKLSDLRGSGTLEQDADMVLFIYREGKATGKVILAKNRNGPSNQGLRDLVWMAQYTKFGDPYRGPQPPGFPGAPNRGGGARNGQDSASNE